jgi:hypothetical protein
MRSFFADMAQCSSSLGSWYEKGLSRNQALEKRANVSDQKYLLNLLERARNKRDFGRGVMEELGFHVSLWNGQTSVKEAEVSVTCGLYWASPRSGVRMGNSVVLNLPEHLGELDHAENMARLLAAVAQAWKPEWAGVMSRNAIGARAFSATVPFVDWMVFVPRKIDAVSPPSFVKELPGLGSLAVVQLAPPSGTDPEELSRIRRVEEAIVQ